MSENYSYRVWTAEGNMVAYITDPAHVPPQYQEELSGLRKEEAIAIVEADKAAAGNDGFVQHTLSEPERIYLRTSTETGNSWEVKYDDEWIEIPNPYLPPDDEEEHVLLEDAKIITRTIGGRVIVVITGKLKD